MRLPNSALDMTRGKPFALLLRFAIPLLVGNIFQQMYNLVDSLVVGNFVGTEALAAVSIGSHPYRVLLAVFTGLGTGATIRISQFTGAGDIQGVQNVVRTANGLILLTTLPIMAIGLLVAGPVLRLMNTPADAYTDAATYLSIIFLSVLGMLGFNLNAGILRGLGDSRSSVLFLIVATVVNIVLDLLFVAVLGLGVAGTAYATVIAIFSSWMFSLVFLKRRYPACAAKLWPIRIDKQTMREVLRLGLPIGLNDALFSLGHMTLSSIVNSHGSGFAAGYSVGSTIDSLSFMPMTSIASATTTYTGQNVGAKQYGRIKSGVKTALLVGITWNVFACMVMIAIGRPMIRLFNQDPVVIEVGYAYILRLEPFYWVYTIMFILNGVMNGSGEVRMPMVANLVLFWLIRLPVAYLLTAVASPNDLFFCYPISWAAGLLVTGTYYLTGRWKRRLKEEEAA